MQIDWWTFALQTINFLVLVWLLWRFLYRPVKVALEKRKALADEAFAEADKQKAEAEDARQRYETDRAALAEERKDLLKRLHGELGEERKTIVEAAQKDAARELEDARATIRKEREAAWRELRGKTADLSVKLASALLENVGQNAMNGAFLGALEDRLAALSKEERERLTRDLAKGGDLKVVTAEALPAGEQDRWRKALSKRLDLKDNIEFATDAAILGGADLHFPHAVLKFSWADQLHKAREQIERDDDAS